MDRKGLEQLIFDTYSVEPDYPWMDTPESAVFRHAAMPPTGVEALVDFLAGRRAVFATSDVVLTRTGPSR